MPRPTPRQRAVLEAMSDGRPLMMFPNGTAALVGHDDVGPRTIAGLLRHGWIRRSSPDFYVITEAGRRAVARSDGGV